MVPMLLVVSPVVNVVNTTSVVHEIWCLVHVIRSISSKDVVSKSYKCILTTIDSNSS